jgi:glucosamine-6-phosphate deaminase
MSVTVEIFPNEERLAAELAARLATELVRHPRLVLGLPTGRTPVALYREIARLAAAGGIDFAQATTFNLDEFLGIPPSHPGSYRQFMDAHLFRHVNIDPSRVHVLNGSAPDPEGECARYERAIVDAGGIDLQLLGIGSNGHIGFNEPAPQLAARTHRVTLLPETRVANADLFGGDPEQVPREALSMGMATILHARSIVLVATGRAKAACIRRMVDGPLTTALPASFLQVHRDATVMLDEAAAAELSPNVHASR